MYKTFLETVLPSNGTYVVNGIKNKTDVRQKYAEDLEGLYRLIENFKKEPPTNIYFALSTFEGLSRKAVDSIFIKSFYLDLDVGKQKNSYETKEAAFVGLDKFLSETGLPEPTIIDSGNGLHVYWILKKELETSEWLPYAKQFKQLCIDRGLIIDPAVPADPARVLRVPYTLNYNVKSGEDPLEVTLINEIKEFDLEEIVPLFSENITQSPQESVFDLSQVKRGVDDETRKMLGLDNYEYVFETIAIESLEGRGCNQIKWILQNAATCPEPMWKAGLSVAIRCVDGATAIHRMSEAYPGYSATETEKKANDCLQAKWAYTCEKFEGENPGGCEGCQFRGKIPSPTHIGKRLRIAQPRADDAPTGDSSDTTSTQNQPVQAKYPKEYLTFPDALFPFIRPVSGGVYYQPAGKPRKDGSMSQEPPFPLLNYDFVPIKRLYSPNDGEALHMRLFLPMDAYREFILPMSVVCATDKFKDFLFKNGVFVSPKYFDIFRDYLVKWAQYLLNVKKAEDMRMQMGWTSPPENGSFVVGSREITPNGVFDCPVSPMTRNVADLLKTSGTYETWRESADMLNQPGFEFHAFAMLTGFGSPLIKFTPATGLVVSLCGEKGAGKTAALHAGLSVFGSPVDQKITTEEGATPQALHQRQSTLNSLLLGLDEASNASPALASKMAYTLPMNTKGKLRLQSSYNVERKTSEGARNIVLMTTNQSIVQKIYAFKDDPGGELRRLFELDMFKPLGKMDDEVGTRIFNPFNTNYGHAGLMFIEACYRLGLPEVMRTVSRWHSRLLTEFSNDTDYTFWNSGIAAVFASAEIATRADVITMDIERVYKVILQEMFAIHKARKKSELDYEELVSEYVTQNLNSLLAINDGKVSIEPRSGKLDIRCEVDTGFTYIVKKPFKEFLKAKNINISQMETALTKANVLYTDEATDKKRMATGWKDAVGSFNLRAYKFKLDVSDVVDIDGPG
jgi:hypothetical protein